MARSSVGAANLDPGALDDLTVEPMTAEPVTVPLRSGEPLSLDVAVLTASYQSGATTLREVVAEVGRRIELRGDDHVWISRTGPEELAARMDELEGLRGGRAEDGTPLPLWGVPFAVKDNIDVAGHVTTAACPAFAYTATRTAPAVQRLLDAGGLLVGKTNMDQFATGLTGTRSPYGACESVFGGGLVSGGSSSGSAVAVAAHLVSFALGTDTAGSGRVPAAMNGIVGLKPTRGLIPTTGVVPACRSLDCVSVFATTVSDAGAVLEAARGYDASDPYSRAASPATAEPIRTPRVGVADPAHLDFFGDTAMQAGYEEASARYTAVAGATASIDIGPLLEAGDLLYGPWVAERLAGLAAFVTAHGDEILPITRRILDAGNRWSGTDVFAATHHLQELRRWADDLWRRIDVLVLPTVGTTFTLDEVEAQPLERNHQLGRYTQFANLLDMAALSVPGGLTADGRPVSVTLVGPAHSDGLLERLACAPDDRYGVVAAPERTVATVTIAVVGRHLSGETRNHELLEHGGTLAATTVTAPTYRLFCIGRDDDAVPGLLRAGQGGSSIEVELWRLPAATVGTFLRSITAPLGLGRIELADGRLELGFLCEAYVTEAATDITASGGWRAYQRQRTPPRHRILEEP